MPPLHPPEAAKRAACAAYVRVSTPQQDAAMQRIAIERAASARGDLELEWYSETRSGRGWVRPELDRLLQAVHEGHHRRVYVWRLDRVSRRGCRDTHDVVLRLRAGGAELVSATEPYDFRPGPIGDMLVMILGFGAALEAESNLERLQAARVRVEAEGRAWGRPSKVMAETAEKIRALRAEGRSIRSIAMAVKVPRSTVFDALANAIAGQKS